MASQQPDNPERGHRSLLDRIDALPTPSPVAMRILSLLDDDSSSATEVVELISSDPALAARVLRTCSLDPRSRSSGIDSLDRAVVLLGFDAVRVSALSVRFIETLSTFGGVRSGATDGFDLALFWRHSLAVAVLSERLALRVGGVRGSTAYMAGLLHDIGHLALWSIAPRIFNSACDLAELECGSVDVVADRRIGISGRAAGRRLATRWRLPAEIVETTWLIDQSCDVLHAGSARELLVMVSLADAMVARDHVCITGHGTRTSMIGPLAAHLGLSGVELEELRSGVLEEVERRADAIGLETLPTTEVLLRSLGRANAVLGRFALAYRDQSASIERCRTDLDALAGFHAAGPFTCVADVIDAIGDSARHGVPNATACVALLPDSDREAPSISLRGSGGTRQIEHSTGMSADITRDVLTGQSLERRGSCLELNPREGGAVLVALGCPNGSDPAAFEPGPALKSAWTAAIEDVRVRERSERLAEQLATANRRIAEQGEALSRNRASTAIAAIAAGAAHEMNNPLAIILGRSHLLARCLEGTELDAAASEVAEAAGKLSGLIRALADSAAPIEVDRVPTDLAALITETSRSTGASGSEVALRCSGTIPSVLVDPDHMRWVIAELIENATRSSGGRAVTIDLQSRDGLLRLRITDSGPGFSERALEHALQPFFSDQSAGRRPGLGLSRVRRLVEAHGGSIRVANRLRGGAEVSIRLPADQGVGVGDRTSLDRTRRVA